MRRRWLRHRRPKPLHRRIFHWFGASIIVTVLVASVTAGLVQEFGPAGYETNLEQAEDHISWHLKERWDEPAARDALLKRASSDFRVRLILDDADGRRLSEFGPECSMAASHVVKLRDDAGHVFGRLSICLPHGFGQAFIRLPLVLLASAMVLWAAAGVIAHVITRPLGDVADVAHAIGRGDLDRRTKPVRHRTAEVQLLAEAIDDMASRIQRQMADQRELLAAVSHELRTPLGHLRVLVELARTRKEDQDKLEKSLQGMDFEVREIDRLVGELLARSRLDFELEHRRAVDAREIAVRALERAQLAESLLAVESDVVFEGDATLLGRALANLLDNAERHAGGPTRLVVGAPDGLVRFVVEDAGPGVVPEEREKIFQPLQRGENQGGSTLGLGLALVARIAKAHGGRAYVETKIGGGARFVLDLPR